MRKLVLSLSLLFSLFIGLSFTQNVVSAAEPITGQDVTFSYTINKDGLETTSSQQTVDYGTTIGIDSGSHAQTGYSFVGFIENNKINPNLNTSESFVITDNTEITLFYKDSNKTAVILMDANQDYIGVWYTDGSNLLDTSTNALPDLSNYSKPGLTTNGWTDGTINISDLSTHEFTSDTAVYVNYDDPNVDNLSLNITNGTADVTGPYDFNQTITVTADGSGTTFNYWEKDGVIASYNEAYTFTMVKDHTLVAVYDDGGFTPHSGNFVYASETYVLKDDYITVLGQFDLAAGEELVEWGIVYSSTEATPTLSTASTTVEYSYKYNPSSNEFVMSFIDTISTVYYRTFVTTIDSSDNLTTDYSSVLTNNVKSTMFTEYGTSFGQDLYLHYRLMSGTTVVQDWTFTAASYGLGSTPDGKNYNWSIEIEVPTGTEIEWKFLVRQDGQPDIWMTSSDRTLPAGKNQFSSWDNVNNEYWFINE